MLCTKHLDRGDCVGTASGSGRGGGESLSPSPRLAGETEAEGTWAVTS